MREIKISPGSATPLGLSQTQTGWNVSVYSSSAAKVSIGIFLPESHKPERVFPLTRSENSWHIHLEGVDPTSLYAFQCEGEKNEHAGLFFDPANWIADPYAKILDASRKWASASPFPPVRSPFRLPDPFDWQGIGKPNISKSDLVIYEMHVRGFTADSSSKAKQPGTYLSLIEKIPYLKQLGVNAIELLPIFEFDELHCKNIDPSTGKRLVNFWGYDPLSFFAPKRNYAADAENPAREFQQMVKELHRAEIEVILDVVYNHTGESVPTEPTRCWRGLDNRTYYLVDRSGKYCNFSGCGNTVNANHPITMEMILASLRYWAEEMQVDGFRFDLASILTRGPDAHPMAHPPLLEAMKQDPILSKVKLIAEGWDATGLYQLGQFPKWGPWSEWNGRYRDVLRRFLKGTNGKAGLFASCLSGSDFLYRESGTPLSSVNFITAHDGYSLRDLVTYQDKHNLENGEGNQDGSNTNDSWNCGAEGATQDSAILQLRERQMRNFLLALFLSQGIPMLLMGDEYGHTRNGNNNPYVQDNKRNWFLWDQLEKNKEIFQYVKHLIELRKAHPELRWNRFLTESDIQWHGCKPDQADFSAESRFVAFSTKHFYAAFNADYRPASVTFPFPCRMLIDTSKEWRDCIAPPDGPILAPNATLPPHSSLLLTRAPNEGEAP